MKKITLFILVILSILYSIPVYSLNFYWKSSLTDLQDVSSPQSGDRGIVITDTGVLTFYYYDTDTWVPVNTITTTAADGDRAAVVENNTTAWSGCSSDIYGISFDAGAAKICMNGTKYTPQYVQAVAYTSLPSCAAGTEGMLRGVTDSNTETWGATVSNGGSYHILAYCNGTNWTVAGK